MYSYENVEDIYVKDERLALSKSRGIPSRRGRGSAAPAGMLRFSGRLRPLAAAAAAEFGGASSARIGFLSSRGVFPHLPERAPFPLARSAPFESPLVRSSGRQWEELMISNPRPLIFCPFQVILSYPLMYFRSCSIRHSVICWLVDHLRRRCECYWNWGMWFCSCFRREVSHPRSGPGHRPPPWLPRWRNTR